MVNHALQTRIVAVSVIYLMLFCQCTEGNSQSPVSRKNKQAVSVIQTGYTKPAQLITFARSLTGTPYLYASTDPARGFDCSGFITYVFNHFGIVVPRSSVGFTNAGIEILQTNAKPGDLILFTGTNSAIRAVGHMGIIVSTGGGDIRFIHSTSGRANGVTETSLYPNYIPRLMKIIRIFP